MTIKRITILTDSLFMRINKLMQELSSTYTPNRKHLEKMLQQQHNAMYGLFDEDNNLQGCYTLGFYDSPTGSKACLEDVVVSSDARGKGYGKQLIQDAIERLQQSEVKQVLLTSKPSRIAANKLYKKMGFTAKETNVYTMSFDTEKLTNTPINKRNDW